MEVDKDIQLQSIGKEVLKEMTKKWKAYINRAEAKYKSHVWASRYWAKINKALLTMMVLLGTAATLLALLPSISIFIVAGIAAVFTLLTCLYAVLRPAEKKHRHLRSSKDFQNLMMRMVSCKSGIEFEELWQDFNRTVFEEPHLKKRHVFPVNENSESVHWSMTQELSRYIESKKEEAKRMVKQYTNRCVGTTSDLVSVEHQNMWASKDRPVSTFYTSTHNSYHPSSGATYGQHAAIQQGPSSYGGDHHYNNNNSYKFASNGFDQRVMTTNSAGQIVETGGDDAFEVLIAQKSHQEVWEDGKRKKRSTFEQFRRSASTK